MTKLAKKFLTLSIFLGIIFVLPPSLIVQAQSDRQPTEQEVRAHLFKLAKARQKNRSRGFTGWEAVYSTKKGSTVYSYFRGGEVTGLVVGRPNMLNLLRKYAPTGKSGGQTGSTSGGVAENPNTKGTTGSRGTRGTTGVGPNTTGAGVAEAPPTGDGPTQEECAAKYVECMWSKSLIDTILGGGAILKGIFTLDFEGLQEQVDRSDEQMKECVGEKCTTILGL